MLGVASELGVAPEVGDAEPDVWSVDALDAAGTLGPTGPAPTGSGEPPQPPASISTAPTRPLARTDENFDAGGTGSVWVRSGGRPGQRHAVVAARRLDSPTREADAGHMEAVLEDVRVARVREQLRTLGHRVTPVRVAVATVLAQTTEHLGAAEIADRCARLDPGVHRATVYRALGILTELGVVSHTHTSAAGAVYHLAGSTAPAGHAHLECTGCGRIVDVPADLLVGLAAVVAVDHGFTLEPDHSTLLGRCRTCLPERGHLTAGTRSPNEAD